MAAKCSNYQSLITEEKGCAEARTELNEELKNYSNSTLQSYQNDLNSLLEKFCTSFRIAQIRSKPIPNSDAFQTSFALQIDGKTIEAGGNNQGGIGPNFSNTLSTGDRATLAFCFFLIALKRRGQSLATSLVVFDDPLSSLDIARHHQTVSQICRIIPEIRQLMVFSHDAFFLHELECAINKKIVGKQKHSLRLTDTYDAGKELFEECDYYHLSAQEGQQAIIYLKKFIAGEENDAEKARALLRIAAEYIYRTSYQGYFDYSDDLNRMCEKIEDYESNPANKHPATSHKETMENINSYSSQSHHAGRPGSPRVLTDVSHVRSMARDLLIKLNALPGAPLANDTRN